MNIKTVLTSNHSSLNVGGEGKLVEVVTEEGLEEVVRYAESTGLRIHILAGGTNSFFGDDLSHILFIRPQFDQLVFDNEKVTAGASVVWDDLVKESVVRNLWGVENLSLIPGTVGAAPVQNIGAYGAELKDVFSSLRTYDMKEKKYAEFSRGDCQFGYRDSIFKKNPERYCIISVTLSLSHMRHPILTYKPLDKLSENIVTLQEIRNLVVETRKNKLPDYNEYPNAGSFFKNTTVDENKAKELQIKYPNIPLHEVEDGYKVPAAWLIEHVAEMKGVRKGSLGTWPMQPLVIVNYAETTGEELIKFSQTIIDIIREKTGIVLEREVNFVV